MTASVSHPGSCTTVADVQNSVVDELTDALSEERQRQRGITYVEI